eukprot:tig00020537_g10296.t1
MSGKLFKNKSGFNKFSKLVQNWDARFFVLNDTILSYYESEKDTEARAVFPLVSATCKRVKRTLCSLLLKLPKRTLLLKAENEETIDAWYKAIIAAITKARGGQPPPEMGDEDDDEHDQGAGVSANGGSKRTSHDSGMGSQRSEDADAQSSRSLFSVKSGKGKDAAASPIENQELPPKAPSPLQRAASAAMASGSEDEVAQTAQQSWGERPAGPSQAAVAKRAPSARTTSKPFHFFEEEAAALEPPAPAPAGPKSPQRQGAPGPDIRDALAKGSFRAPGKPPLPPAGSGARKSAGRASGGEGSEEGAGEAGRSRVGAQGPASPLAASQSHGAAVSPSRQKQPAAATGVAPDKNWVDEDWDSDEERKSPKAASPSKRDKGATTGQAGAGRRDRRRPGRPRLGRG